MIHTYLQNFHDMNIGLILTLVAGLCPALAAFLLVKRGDRWAALMFLGLTLIVAPLAWGTLTPTTPLPSQFKWSKDLNTEYGRKLIGPDEYRGREQIIAAAMLLGLALTYIGFDRQGLPAIGARQTKKIGAQDVLGAATLCPPEVFKRNWGKADPLGMTFNGKFWGDERKFLGPQLHLSGEDVARGLAAIGGQGSGKTQAVILPTIAARMINRHSLVVTDVQGELLPYILPIAGQTGHQVIVHNPSAPTQSAAYNLVEGIHDPTDAKAIATILLSAANPDDFWSASAINLLAACMLHYPNLGAIMTASTAPREMGTALQQAPNAAIRGLAGAFINSVLSDSPKLAHNILATMTNQAISAWADPQICAVTATSQFGAATLTDQPTVIVLRCARKHQDTLGKYLGALLAIYVTELDSLGEAQPRGLLPRPVGLILEEFPTLGRLESLVTAINVVRKRRISVLIAAQTLGQFYGIYGREGTQTLLAGLATKIVFGGCDLTTAEYFSELSGQTTIATASISEQADGAGIANISASVRGRALLMPDTVIQPPRITGTGSGTIFAAGAGQQQILHTQLQLFWQASSTKKLTKVTPAIPLAPTNITVASLPATLPPTPPVAPPAGADEDGHDASLEPVPPEHDREIPPPTARGFAAYRRKKR